MAEYTVTISELNSTAAKFKAQAETFVEAANTLLQATTDLTSSGWKDDASEIFQDKITELKSWCDNMGTVIDSYSAALNKIGEEIQAADEYGASQFKN